MHGDVPSADTGPCSESACEVGYICTLHSEALNEFRVGIFSSLFPRPYSLNTFSPPALKKLLYVMPKYFSNLLQLSL